MNLKFTDYEADALATTPSRRSCCSMILFYTDFVKSFPEVSYLNP